MRKYQRQQIENRVANLHDYHQESRNHLSRNDFPVTRDILGRCQKLAIEIGESIEQTEGEGTETVSFLEQYCERVYQVSEQMQEMTAQKAYRYLEEILIKAENEIRRMPVRKEVVFLPYKASMWDSLESVYLAAKEDEQCDAYVVPIPYYDKNADKSLGEMHYEGGEYPDDIEITYYEEYSFEERRPDAIYIHNPYDGWNRATCVPERFFSRNLKQYTDLLVYIPYFILDEIEPDNQGKIESMKHFCFQPGVIYADKVIVQSEKMRQIYINEYLKAAKEYGLRGEYADRKKLENKILGLGSPKLDRIRRMDKEAVELPEAWRRIIEKPDGTWKKVILYNTGIGQFLQSTSQMLVKIRAVFRIFKENQDKAALLWRPHPLMENTIKAIHPELWQEYERLAAEYRQEGWGIYDDSADMDRAVLLSDAYYGDHSSLIRVYQETGKPVMLQDVDYLYTMDKI